MRKKRRQRADANFRQARQAVDEYFTHVSENTLLKEPALEPLRKQLLQSALRYNQEFVREHGDDPEVQAELAAAYLRIANLIYVLGPEEDWLSPVEEAVTALEKLLPKKPDLSALQSLQAGIIRPLAAGLRVRQPAETRRIVGRAVALWEDLVRAHPTVPGFQNDLAALHLIIAVCWERSQQHDEAVASYRKACGLWQKLVAANPEARHYRASLVISLSNLSGELAVLGQLAEAEAADQQALEMATRLAADFPEVPTNLELLSWCCRLVGEGREHTNRLKEAEE